MFPQFNRNAVSTLLRGETLCPSRLTIDPAENVSIIMDTDVESQPSNETKRSLLADSAVAY